MPVKPFRCWSWSYETCVLGKGFATCQDLSVKIRIECDEYKCFQHSVVCDMLPSSKQFWCVLVTLIFCHVMFGRCSGWNSHSLNVGISGAI